MIRNPFIIPLLLAWAPVSAQFGAQAFIETNEADGPVALLDLDVDVDGLLDLVVSFQTGNRIAWYRNEGQGVFGPQQALVDNAQYFVSLVAMDVDANGLLDIVGASILQDKVYWCRNDGNAVFTPPILVANTGQQPRDLRVADLDGDGLDDLAYCTRYGGTVEWVKHIGGYDWSLAQVIDTPGVNTWATQVADMDGDGDTDVLSSTYQGPNNNVGWYSNQGGGTFSARIPISLAVDSITCFVVSDLDGDGSMDVAMPSAVNNEMHLYLNDGTGVFVGPFPVGSGLDDVWHVTAGDLDLDGDNDLVMATTPVREVRMYRNEGGGAFDQGTTLTTTIGDVSSLLLFDLDNDGWSDPVYSSQTTDRISWHRNGGAGGMGAQLDITTQVPGAAWVSTADLDGDLDLDVLCAAQSDHRVSWYENNGNGAFGVQQTISNQVLNAKCAIAADVDGDDDADVLAASWALDAILLFTNDGTGSFGPGQTIATSTNEVCKLISADLDLDGDPDLVASGTSYLAYLLNDGTGTFAAPVVFTGYVTGVVPFDLADLNSDGLLDVVHTTSGYSRLAWFMNLGGGTFSSQIVIENYVSSGPLVTAGDIDRDGDPDLVLGTAPLRWYSNNGDATFAPFVQFGSENGQADALVVFDVEGDTYVDVIASNDYLNWISFYRNLGNGTFGPQLVVPSLIDNPTCLHAANVDFNPTQDLFCTSHYDGGLSWFRNYFGSHFRAEGRRFIDTDLDGISDPDEPGVGWGQLSCAPYMTYALTDPDGNYSFSLDTGSYQVAALGQGALWELVTPATSYAIQLSEQMPVEVGLDFGYAPMADTSIIIPSLVIGNGPCGGSVPLWITYTNNGTRVEQGVVHLYLDTTFGFVSSDPPPDMQQANHFTWAFDSLGFFQMGSIEVVITRPGIDMMGSTTTSTLVVQSIDAFGNPTGSWQDVHVEAVTCSYDPNDKQVSPPGYGDQGAVPLGQEHLDYTIRFQNTGTATAYNVVLHDAISAHLDRESLQVLACSHDPSDISIDEDGVLLVRFDGIMLADSGANLLGSQGFIRMRFAMNEDATNLAQVHNTAEIFFDLNPAVLTNTTVNTLVDCDQWQPLITVVQENVLGAPEGDAYQWFLNGEPMSGEVGPVIFIGLLGSYAVQVTSEHGCVAMTDTVEVIALGAASASIALLTVVPSPAATHAVLHCNTVLSPDHRVDVVDVHGRVVRKLRGAGTTSLVMERGELGPGVYLVRLLEGSAPLGTARLVFE